MDLELQASLALELPEELRPAVVVFAPGLAVPRRVLPAYCPCCGCLARYCICRCCCGRG